MRSIAIILGIILGGCVSQGEVPQYRLPHQNPTTTAEHCANGFYVMGLPGGTPAQNAMIMEIMRNRGCFGQPQPQTLQLR